MSDTINESSVAGAGLSRRVLLAGIGAASAAASIPAAQAAEPRRMIKALTAVTRRPEMPREEFLHQWTVVHAGMARGVPAVARFVANIVVAEPARADVPDMLSPGLIDGFAEVWLYADMIADVAKTPEGKAWYAHGAWLFGKTHNFRVEEITVLWRDGGCPAAT